MVDGKETMKRIDHYWSKVLAVKTASGTIMFPTLGKLVKACLCLSHGNADVERSLFIAKHVLGPERTGLTEESINGLRSVKDAVESSGKKIHEMSYPKEMVRAVQGAHAVYHRRLDEEKKQEEAKKKKRDEERARNEAQAKDFEERKRKHQEEEKSLQQRHKE